MRGATAEGIRGAKTCGDPFSRDDRPIAAHTMARIDRLNYRDISVIKGLLYRCARLNILLIYASLIYTYILVRLTARRAGLPLLSLRRALC